MSASIKNTAYSLIGLLLLVMAWQLGATLMAERMPLAHLLAPLPTFQSLFDLLINNQLTVGASRVRLIDHMNPVLFHFLKGKEHLERVVGLLCLPNHFRVYV